MTPWVLDDGPFGDLALYFDAAWAWPADTLHLVGEVARGAQQDKSGRRLKLLQMTSGAAPSIRVHDIQVGTPASDMLFNHLRQNATDATSNLGEHASIAFCAVDAPDALFVPADKLAAYLALCELGPSRVASPFDLWEHLRSGKHITQAQFDLLCVRTTRMASLPAVPRRFVRV